MRYSIAICERLSIHFLIVLRDFEVGELFFGCVYGTMYTNCDDDGEGEGDAPTLWASY